MYKRQAVITNIGVTHIENLGSRENILKEKLRIQDGMKKGGTLFLNGDNELLRDVRAKAVSYTHIDVYKRQVLRPVGSRR